MGMISLREAKLLEDYVLGKERNVKIPPLTDNEKDYIKKVIKPVEKKVVALTKENNTFLGVEWITFYLNNGMTFGTYSFPIGSEFKGIQKIIYRIDELGLNDESDTMEKIIEEYDRKFKGIYDIKVNLNYDDRVQICLTINKNFYRWDVVEIIISNLKTSNPNVYIDNEQALDYPTLCLINRILRLYGVEV